MALRPIPNNLPHAAPIRMLGIKRPLGMYNPYVQQAKINIMTA